MLRWLHWIAYSVYSIYTYSGTGSALCTLSPATPTVRSLELSFTSQLSAGGLSLSSHLDTDLRSAIFISAPNRKSAIGVYEIPAGGGGTSKRGGGLVPPVKVRQILPKRPSKPGGRQVPPVKSPSKPGQNYDPAWSPFLDIQSKAF